MLHSKHIAALDGLRGCAVLLVMCAHYFGLFNLGHGSLGVDVFFVLSGYLITSILLREIEEGGRISFLNFYARRALRLLPALFLMVAAFAAIDLAAGIRPPELVLKSAFASLLSYPSNWIRAYDLWNMIEFGHTWSLAIEDQFYLAWPIVLLIAFRATGSRWLTAAIIVSVCVAIGVYRASIIQGGAPAVWVSAATHMRIDGILVGCVAALLLPYCRSETASRAISIGSYVAVAALVFLIVVRSNYLLWQQPIATVATAIIVLHLASTRESRLREVLSQGWLTVTGKISYGLYLYHYPMVYLAVYSTPLAKLPQDTKQAICLFILMPASFAVALASYKYIEAPILKMKSRFTPSGATETQSHQPQQPAPQPSPPLPQVADQFALARS